MRWLDRTTTHLRVWALLVAVVSGLPGRLTAQDSVPVEPKRPLATRAELQLALDEADKIANSDAFSPSFRQEKRDEAAVLRERLLEGDFFVGDQLNISLVGDSGFSGTYTIQFGRMLTLPGLPDVPMKGVLRSEVQDYVTQQVGRFIKDPQLKVRPLIRLTFMGGIGRPGFYQMDADILLSDALMQAGGIGNSTELKRSEVKRSGEKIIEGDAIEKGVIEGITLDQLNLRAGDEITVGQKSNKDWFKTLRTFAVIPALIVSTYGLGRLLGVF